MRNAAVQRLKDANIQRVGQNVFADQSQKYFQDKLPAMSVYTRRNPCNDNDTAPYIYDFVTDLSVETVVVGDYNDGTGIVTTADQLNFFSQQIIDTLIYNWPAEGPLDGLVNEILLRGIYSGASQEGEKTIKGEVVKFDVVWNELLPNAHPENDFARMGYSLLTPEGANAEDLDTDNINIMDPEG